MVSTTSFENWHSHHYEEMLNDCFLLQSVNIQRCDEIMHDICFQYKCEQNNIAPKLQSLTK